MQGLLIRWIINAGGLILVAALLDGVHLDGLGWALGAALVLGILNALIRPVLFILTFPLTILTMGLFALVVNGLVFWFAGSVLRGFVVDGLGSAILGALLMVIISLITNSWFRPPNHPTDQNYFYDERRRDITD